MRFTYLDILEQCFHDKFRGYSKQEVDTFLQLVADDFKEMSEEIKLFKKESDKNFHHITDLENQIKKLESNNGNGDGYQEIEEPLSAIRQKAQHILQQTKAQASLKCKNAEKELNRIREEIKLLKGERENLLKNLKAGAKNYLKSLYKKN